MKHLKKYQLFEFVETSSNTPLLYKDDNIEVKVVKTLDATKQQNKDTEWCSTKKAGFYNHNKTANMYRINFKDGYKLRLTWDYIHQSASELGSYSGGTHWGQGGILNGEKQRYDVFRPIDNDDPFYIDWQSEKEREIVNRIKSLPKDAIDSINEYQNKSSVEKNAILNKLYSEIQKIKIVDANEKDHNYYDKIICVKFKYENDVFKLFLSEDSIVEGRKDIDILREGDYDKFIKKFKNKYVEYDESLKVYLYDRAKEFLKKNVNVNEAFGTNIEYREDWMKPNSPIREKLETDINDILQDIKDYGYRTMISGWVLSSFQKCPYVWIQVNTNLGHNDEVFETIERIKHYLELEGYKFWLEEINPESLTKRQIYTYFDKENISESEIYNGAWKHYNGIKPVNQEIFKNNIKYSYKCNDCKFDFVTYDSNQQTCNVCESENIERVIINEMKHLKKFNEHKISIFSQDWKKYLPETLEIITDNGEFKLVKKDLMINGDLIQFDYYHNTPEERGGDVLADGEPDFVSFDIHTVKNNVGDSANPDTLSLNVDITYGDAMVSSFKIEKDSQVNVGHYTGKDSMHDPNTFFAFSDKSLNDLIIFFNRFGFNLSIDKFLFLKNN